MKVVLLGLLVLLLAGGSNSEAIPLAGSNGSVVDFAGVKSAGPGGLSVKIQENGDLIEVPWDRFDLERLRADHPAIFDGYQKATQGEVKELNLGVFAPKVPNAMAREMKNFEDGGERHGWFETGAGGGKFAIQLPSGEPRGVLFISFGQTGRSISYIGGLGASRWSDFAEKFQFAVMSYQFGVPEGRPGPEVAKGAKFIKADEGSGKAVLEALNSFAQKSQKAVLAEAPIAIYGADALGAAFGYNLAQTMPERVIAVVASKGAFYSVKPTEESAKVPVLFIWGEYDSDIEIWQPTDTLDEIYPAALELKPNWINAMEPRGPSGESPFSQKFATTFLDRMILARLGSDGEMKDLDVSRAWIGDLDTFKIARMENPDEALQESQTWLPDGEIAKMWEEFLNGTMKLDIPEE